MKILDVADFFIDLSDGLDKEKRSFFYAETLGRIIKFNSTEKFFTENSLINDKELSKKEKNIIANALINNPNKDFIINEYNQNCTSGEKIQDVASVFKKISYFSNALKAPMYNNEEFTKNVLSKVIEWSVDGDNESIETLRLGLSQFIDTKTLSDFIGINSETKKQSFGILKAFDFHKKLKNTENNSLILWGALCSLAIPNAYNLVAKNAHTILSLGSSYIQETSKNIINNAPAMISQLGDIGLKISETLINNPAVFSVTVGALTMFTFYKTFQKFHGFGKKIMDKYEDKQIKGVSLKNVDDLDHRAIISKNILDPILYKKMDLSNEDNINYIEINNCLLEKLYTGSISEISARLSYGFKNEEINKLKNLSIEEIHEISLVRNPRARLAISIWELSQEEKNLFKNISAIEMLGEFKINKDGNYFSKFNDIKNLNQSTIDKISKCSKVEKEIILSYLNLYTNEAGYCSKTTLRFVDNTVSSKNSIIKQIQAELDTEFFNVKPEIPKKEDIEYIKRIWKYITSKEYREESKLNTKLRDVMSEMAQSNSMSFANSAVKSYNTSLEGLKMLLKIDSSSLLSKIKNIRNKSNGEESQNEFENKGLRM